MEETANAVAGQADIAVNPLKNVERFAPTKARFVRFTSFNTIDNDRHEP